MMMTADAIGAEDQERSGEHKAENHLHSLMADVIKTRWLGVTIGSLRSALGTQ